MRVLSIALQAFALAAVAFSAAPAQGQGANKGWWVVVASYPADPPERQRADLARTEAAAARCEIGRAHV